MGDKSFSLGVTYGDSSFVPWSPWSLGFHAGPLVLWTNVLQDLAAFKVAPQTLS